MDKKPTSTGIASPTGTSQKDDLTAAMPKFQVGQSFNIIYYLPSNDTGHLEFLDLTLEDGCVYRVMVERGSYRPLHDRSGARFRGYIEEEPPPANEKSGQNSLDIRLTHSVDGYILWGNRGGGFDVVSG